jgi:hypothetical protein
MMHTHHRIACRNRCRAYRLVRRTRQQTNVERRQNRPVPIRCQFRAGALANSLTEQGSETEATGFPTRSCFTEENGAQSVQLETIAL